METKGPVYFKNALTKIDNAIKMVNDISCDQITQVVNNNIDKMNASDRKGLQTIITDLENNQSLVNTIIGDIGKTTGKINCLTDAINNSKLNLPNKIQYKNVSDIEYHIAKAIIDNNKDVKEKIFRDSGSLLYMILAIVFFIVILVMGFFMIYKNKKSRK